MPHRSPPSRKRAAGWRGSSASALLLVALPAAAWIGGDAQEVTGRLDGEYGLYVVDAGDTLEVHWLTAHSDSGYLEARVADSVLTRRLTPPGRAHHAVVVRAGDGLASELITLRYGAAGGSSNGLHETVIRLPPERAQVQFGPVDSLFVVGDVHGEFDTLTAVLRNAGLIDPSGSWTGGRSHLVFLGDIFDRGPDVTRTLWFIYGLEPRAEAVGGRVHLVLGNHEIMVLTDDLRYTSLRELAIAAAHGVSYPRLFDIRTSVLGRWLATKPGLIRIGPVLLAHGGVSAAYAEYSLQAFDDTLASFMSEEFFYRWSLPEETAPPGATPIETTLPQVVLDSAAAGRRVDFFFDENNVFWYRGYVQADTLADELGHVLDRFDSRVHVVAHTPVDEVTERYGGALLTVDLSEAATQLLLLVRDSRTEELQAFRIGASGPPEPLGSSGSRPDEGPGCTRRPEGSWP